MLNINTYIIEKLRINSKTSLIHTNICAFIEHYIFKGIPDLRREKSKEILEKVERYKNCGIYCEEYCKQLGIKDVTSINYVTKDEMGKISKKYVENKKQDVIYAANGVHFIFAPEAFIIIIFGGDTNLFMENIYTLIIC